MFEYLVNRNIDKTIDKFIIVIFVLNHNIQCEVRTGFTENPACQSSQKDFNKLNQYKRELVYFYH